MTEPAVNKSDVRNDKPLPFKLKRLVNHIANNPAITLAIGLTLAGFGTIFNPDKKWPKNKTIARIPKGFAMNWPLAGLAGYVGLITVTQLFYPKVIYRHAVGIELNKKTEDVNLIDVLFRTKNTVVHNTWKDFGWKIMGRTVALGIPLIPWLSGHRATPHPSIMSGATGIENGIEKLDPTVWDKILVITRIQKEPTDSTTPDEIKDILASHRKQVCKKEGIPCLIPAPGSEEAKNEDILAEFIAKAIDENRKRWESNAPKLYSGDFAPDTLIYLMGNKAEGTNKSFIEQSFPINFAYVLLAKEDNGFLTHVKQAAHAIATGQSPDTVFQQYGIDLNALSHEKEKKGSAMANTIDTNNQQPEQGSLATASLVPNTQLYHAQETSTRDKNATACRSCQN